jgi:hypothetical protein
MSVEVSACYLGQFGRDRVYGKEDLKHDYPEALADERE